MDALPFQDAISSQELEHTRGGAGVPPRGGLLPDITDVQVPVSTPAVDADSGGAGGGGLPRGARALAHLDCIDDEGPPEEDEWYEDFEDPPPGLLCEEPLGGGEATSTPLPSSMEAPAAEPLLSNNPTRYWQDDMIPCYHHGFLEGRRVRIRVSSEIFKS